MNSRTWIVQCLRWAFVALCIAVSACAQEANANVLQLSGGLVALPAVLSDAPVERVGEAGVQFYLALKRSELGVPYFLTTYLKQIYPLTSIPASVLDAKVVSFELQNGRLYMFDVDKRKRSSKQYDPDVVIDAYDVIASGAAVDSVANAGEYLTFDPSSGRNDFGVLSSTLSVDEADGGRFTQDLSFLDRFLSLPDGVQYDLVFAGHFERALTWNDGSLQDNPLLFNGSASVALRRYREGAGFTPMSTLEQSYFMSSPGSVETGSGQVSRKIARWNTRPGATPIRWGISAQVEELQRDPRYARYDLVGAIRAGVEAWNSAFGYRALEAIVESEQVDPGDEDKNFIIVDGNARPGEAFANLRLNPNTGETRGATVYLSSYWFDYARMLFDPHTLEPETRVRLAALIDEGRAQSAAHGYEATTDVRRIGAREEPTAEEPGQDVDPVTAVQGFITHIVMHEIGHTLGLRHNFMGSLEPPTSSVMDYVRDELAYSVTTPQRYDIEAIGYLYLGRTSAPAGPFCTDDDVGTSTALCAPFDFGANPLEEMHAPLYASAQGRYLSGESADGSQFDLALAGVLDFVRAGSLEQARSAFQIATRGMLAPSSRETLQALGWKPERVDETMRKIWGQLLEADLALGALHARAVPLQAVLGIGILAHLRSEILNEDGVRSFGSRRHAVYVLKFIQTVEAMALLEQIALELRTASTGTSPDAALNLDLARYAETQLEPYFESEE